MGYCICERCGRFDEFRVRAFYRIMHYFYFRVNFIECYYSEDVWIIRSLLVFLLLPILPFPTKNSAGVSYRNSRQIFFQKGAGVSAFKFFQFTPFLPIKPHFPTTPPLTHHSHQQLPLLITKNTPHHTQPPLPPHHPSFLTTLHLSNVYSSV